MKLLFLLLPVFIAGSPAFAFWGKSTQWPTNWRQFKYPPKDIQKPYITVKFTQSIDVACKKYKVARKAADRAESARDAAFRRFEQKLIYGEAIESDYNQFIDRYYQKLWRADSLETAAGVEVLRQWGDPDWKKYSLYSSRGVGEKWREGINAGKFKPIDSGFSVLPYPKLSDICN